MEWRDINLTIGQWAKWAGIRLLIITPAVVLEAGYHTSRLLTNVFDSSRKSYYKLIQVYDLIPLGGFQQHQQPLRVIEATTSKSEIEPVTDIISALEGRQVIILGESGAGKSTVAQWLAFSIGGKVRVYEPEGTPTDWQGLEVIGRGEDYVAIEVAMKADLEDLTQRIQTRNEKGDAGLAGMQLVTIAEELPELIDKVATASEWVERHLRRGRKSLRFMIGLAQDDTVAALGLEGKGGLRKAFRYVRLGKLAVDHAKRLKADDLVAWLKADRRHALIDDEPLLLPTYQEMRAVIGRFSAPSNLLTGHYQLLDVPLTENTPGSTVEVGFQPSEGLQKGSENTLESRFFEVFSLILEGKSDYHIAKNLFGIEGGSSLQTLSSKLKEIREKVKANA